MGPVKITDWTPVGSIFKHAEYKLEVNLDGSFWEVYRRYSQFVTLDNAIRALLGAIQIQESNYSPTLPGRDIPGWLTETLVKKRIAILNQYLTEIVAYNPPDQHKESIRTLIRDFLDTEYRGKSGIRLSLENKKGSGHISIIRESFNLVARPKTYNMIYQGCYTAISSSKVLYICSNFYDSDTDAKHTIKLDSGGYKVESVDDKNFNLIGNNLFLSWKFHKSDDCAHWMRTIADATLDPVVERSTETSRRAEQQRIQQQMDAEAQAKSDAAIREATIKHEQRPGNKVDMLQNEFGV